MRICMLEVRLLVGTFYFGLRGCHKKCSVQSVRGSMRRHRPVANFQLLYSLPDSDRTLYKHVSPASGVLSALCFCFITTLLHHENRLRSRRLRCCCCNCTVHHSILHYRSNSRNYLQSWQQVRALPISSNLLEEIHHCNILTR